MSPRLIASLAVAFYMAAPAGAQELGPNGLQKIMLYRSFIQDVPTCAVTASGGVVTFKGPTAASAAASCPDAFAWAQLVDAVSGEFWNWGIDQTVWPSEPWPLCSDAVTANCCDPNRKINPAVQPAHCPVFRADYDPISPLPASPNGRPSQNVINHRGLVEADEIDPGRLLRDLELELVFRNKPLVEYIYRNDLYSKEGMGARNRAQNAAINTGDIGAAHRWEVRFPVDAVMVKVDLLHQDIMLDVGLIKTENKAGKTIDPPNNPEYPYLTVYIGGNGSEGQVPGMYYLLAMTNASKDLPIWHWYAVEHVANQGRCDYIGCNDSFGYATPGVAHDGANFGSTYIPPMIELNDDQKEPGPGEANPNDPLFVTGKFYDPTETGELITHKLDALFRGMGVGTGTSDLDPNVISADDPAWRNYRLKGTQTTFTTAGGVPTGQGATITEGGFVNSASCTTCHSQASVDANGTPGIQGVGSSWRPNLLGYTQVMMGSPDLNWFYSNGGPSVTATQIDFVWGILNAGCQDPAGSHGTCTSYPDAPTIIPPQ